MSRGASRDQEQNKRFTTLKLIGGIDCVYGTVRQPDLEVQGGARIKKTLCVEGKTLLSSDLNVDKDLVVVGNLSVLGTISGNIDGGMMSDSNLSGEIICANSKVQTDLIEEKTANAGVTIDGVLIKDGGVIGDVFCANDRLQTDRIESKTTGSSVTIDGNVCITENLYTTIIGPKSPSSSVIFGNCGDQYAWVQRGLDIPGAGAQDQYGLAASMSADGNTISAHGRGVSYGSTWTGVVGVYDWNGSTWVQRGTDIIGIAGNARFGLGHELSEDGDTIVIGEPYDYLDSNVGFVRVYDWSGAAWIQRGTDIPGIAMGDANGFSVSISLDKNTITAGSPGNDTLALNSGLIRVFDWTGAAWVQRGMNILRPGSTNSDQIGSACKLAADGNTLVYGAHEVWIGGNQGVAAVLDWNGAAWVQRGADIVGGINDLLGMDVAITPDGNTIVIRARGLSGTTVPYTQIFDWSGVAWVQRGSNIYAGIANSARLDTAISDDGNTIALGSFQDEITFNNSGLVRVYDWNGTDWILRGEAVEGKAADETSGRSVSMSSDGNTFITGAPSAQPSSTGSVRVYDWVRTCDGDQVDIEVTGNTTINQNATICGNLNVSTINNKLGGNITIHANVDIDNGAATQLLTAIHNSSTTWTYNPQTPGNWNAAAPTTLAQAIDRLAAAYNASHGPVP